MPQGPRRIAILACLAAAGPGGLTRDKLVARLWPDTDDDRARRNLSQLLYAMRTELGSDLVDGTGTLRLVEEVCTADVTAFDAAVAARQDADAVRAYTGAFLDGFHLAESSEFSQWADAERDRRLAQVRTAAVRLADAARGTPEAVGAYRKALSLDPLSAPLALRLMEALVAAGDRAGALRVAEQHESLIRSELDAAGDPAVAARAAELRRAPTGPAAASAPIASGAPTATSASSIPGSATGASADVGASTVTATASAAPAAAPGIERAGARRMRPLLLIGALAAIVFAVTAVTQRAAAPLGDDEYVLIAQFENQTPDSLLTHTLGAAMAAAMQQSAFVVPLPRGRVASALRRMGRKDTTEYLPLTLAREVAEREGVRFVVAGEVLAVGSTRQFVARVIDAASGRVMAAHTFPVAGDDQLLEVIDQAARRMRRELGEARATVREARSLPEVTTASLAALHDYALALDAERSNRHQVARAHYDRAIALDPDFAMVHAKLAESHALNNDVPRATFHGDRALALAKDLPLTEQLRIRMSVAWARGDRESMVSYGRTYVTMRPRDFAAWSRLAFSLFSAGQLAEARTAYATADRLSPLSNGSYLNWGTAWLASARRSQLRADFDSAQHYYERAFQGDSALEYDSFFNHQYGTILLGAGRVDSARATFERMRSRSDLDRARAERSLAYLEAYEGDWANVIGRFVDAAEIGTRQSQWTTAIRNEALVAETHLALGDRARAMRVLSHATAVALREPLEARMVAFVALADVHAGELAAARRLRDRMRASARPEHDAEQAALSFVEGAIELAAGNASLAQERIESGFRRDSVNLQGRILRARALEAVGKDAAAVEAWDAVGSVFEFGAEGQFDWQYADAERGRLLERIGRTEEAATALRRLVSRYPARAGAAEPTVLRDARERLRRLEGLKPRS